MSIKQSVKRLISNRYSNTWQTSIMILFVVLASVILSIFLFWRGLYLPELKSHARYLATELAVLDEIGKNSFGNQQQRRQLRKKMHTEYITNTKEFPEVENKVIAGFFTDIIASEILYELDREVIVYFEFKPYSQLWIQDSKHPEYWILEPVDYYEQYNPLLFIGLILAIIIFAIVSVVLLTRQLNRPLRRLELAATNYNHYGDSTVLDTKHGTREIRQVNTAFNKLFSNLSQSQKERSLMLAGISHDLRTPLTRMRLTAEMLPDEFLQEGLIYDVEDMNAILEQFISFIKDGSDEPVELTDLSIIINEVMVQFKPLQIEYQDISLPLLPLRALSIKRLIINLINNAQRYGEPPIDIQTLVSPISNYKKYDTMAQQAVNELVISIKDYGDGIKENDLLRILQPFERGETARTTQGSGLGLTIVQRIAKLHHGYIEINNHDDSFQVTTYIPLFMKNN